MWQPDVQQPPPARPWAREAADRPAESQGAPALSSRSRAGGGDTNREEMAAWGLLCVRVCRKQEGWRGGIDGGMRRGGMIRVQEAKDELEHAVAPSCPTAKED